MKLFLKNRVYSEYIIAAVVVIWFLVIYLVSQVYICFQSATGCFNVYLLSNWDGQHFLQIAENGYLEAYQLAFFPLFPILMRLIQLIIPLPLWIVGVLINLVGTIGGFVFLAKILLRQKISHPWMILVLILFFPVSFFFVTLYSEALFFLLSLGAIYFYHKDKNWPTILLLTLLTLTRMAGIALVLAILVDLYYRKKFNYWFLIPFIGVGSFAIYGYLKTGILLSIVFAETYWERMVTFPGFALYNSLSILLREGISYHGYSLVADLLLVIGVLIILFRSYRIIPRLYFYYALFSLLIPLSTSTFLSLPRFLLVIFPLFMAFYMWTNNTVRWIYCIVGVMLSVIFFTIFLQGGWVS